MLSKFLDPKNDYAFKRIFASERNKDILIHFLNDTILFKNHGHIVDVQILKTVLDPETASKKISIVDILCTDQNGNIYIVEMQVAKEKGFEKRAQYYASKAYISQANAGGEYHDLKEVIFLAIVDFIMFPDKKAYKSDHVILDRENHDHDLKDFSFTFLELPKFNKDVDHLTTMLDKWAYFFKHADETKEEDLDKIIGNDQIIGRAFKELNRFSWDDEELRTYDQEDKYERIHRAIMAQQFDEGHAKGKLEAMLAIAKTLRKQGIETSIIQSATGLSTEKIENLNFSDHGLNA
jgi:predicted transposase/invertase (TIGR01784 family)